MDFFLCLALCHTVIAVHGKKSSSLLDGRGSTPGGTLSIAHVGLSSRSDSGAAAGSTSEKGSKGTHVLPVKSGENTVVTDSSVYPDEEDDDVDNVDYQVCDIDAYVTHGSGALGFLLDYEPTVRTDGRTLWRACGIPLRCGRTCLHPDGDIRWRFSCPL